MSCLLKEIQQSVTEEHHANNSVLKLVVNIYLVISLRQRSCHRCNKEYVTVSHPLSQFVLIATHSSATKTIFFIDFNAV